MNIGESYTTDRAAAKFVNVIGEVTKEGLKTDLTKARYYSILNDGSTDVTKTEQELVYVLFLHDEHQSSSLWVLNLLCKPMLKD